MTDVPIYMVPTACAPLLGTRFQPLLVENYIGNPTQSELSLNFEFCISSLINTPRNFLANSGIPVVLKVWVWVSMQRNIIIFINRPLVNIRI